MQFIEGRINKGKTKTRATYLLADFSREGLVAPRLGHSPHALSSREPAWPLAPWPATARTRSARRRRPDSSVRCGAC